MKSRGPKRWGLLCPEDGGMLLENPDWGDKVWCPSNGHGGNGRFYDPAEVTEGYEMTNGSGLTAAQQRALEAQGQELRDAADEPVEAPPAKRKERVKVESAEPKPRKAKDPRDCECGCGGQTKGGRFIPGHDAKLHAHQKAEAKAAAAAAAGTDTPD